MAFASDYHFREGIAMHAAIKTGVAGITALAVVGLTAGVAEADNAIVAIKKNAMLSATSKIVYVQAKVTCSEDTTSASLTATLTQVTTGGAQTATSSLTGINAFECSGEEETVWLPVRRPTGGFKWVAGSARVTALSFVTADPSGTFTDTAKGRTVTVR